jgi:hypothetical protein
MCCTFGSRKEIQFLLMANLWMGSPDILAKHFYVEFGGQHMSEINRLDVTTCKLGCGCHRIHPFCMLHEWMIC